MLIRWLLSSAVVTSSAAFAQNCSGLSTVDPKILPNPTTKIDSAVANPARAVQGNTPALPDHCEVIGKINERTGMYSQHYAIRFHLRLPAAWNGRFFFEGGGGSNGNLGTALGNLQGQQRSNALTL